jgi:hypothetical protein
MDLHHVSYYFINGKSIPENITVSIEYYDKKENELPTLNITTEYIGNRKE